MSIRALVTTLLIALQVLLLPLVAGSSGSGVQLALGGCCCELDVRAPEPSVESCCASEEGASDRGDERSPELDLPAEDECGCRVTPDSMPPTPAPVDVPASVGGPTLLVAADAPRQLALGQPLGEVPALRAHPPRAGPALRALYGVYRL